MENRYHFLNTTLPPAMTWHSLPPVPEQSLDSFFNPNYDHSVLSSILKENIPKFEKSMLINPNLTPVLADPGFIERAARFSPFGSHSFNGRTTQLGINNTELGQLKSNPVSGNLKLARVSSTPSLRSNYSKTQVEIRPIIGSSSSPNEGSSVSEQFPIGETEEKFPSDWNPRKRKAVSKRKSQKVVVDEQDDRDSKRCKSNDSIENGNDNDEKQNEKKDEAIAKAPEPPKDYIHVRARRGQATDSHSLAERVRREKISGRMKLLQDLVPGCNKVTGKALMLDEIINYVQSLQRQVEFLSMKLASIDHLDFNSGSDLSKDVSNSSYPVDSPSLFGHKAKTDFSNGPITHCSLDPSDTTLFRDISLQLPFVDDFCQGFAQFSGSYEDDLQRIVQMGFGQNPNTHSGTHSQIFAGSSDTTNMRIKL